MVMAGYEYMGKRPFEHVYFTGTVRDMQRRKMSKSLGNSPDALELIDRFGADGVRVGMLLCSAAGNDLMFEEQLTEQGRNFSNKIWNAFRLVQTWKEDLVETDEPVRKHAIALFEARMHQVFARVEEQMAEYRVSEALLELYRLFWDDFSAWFLEFVKPRDGKKMDKDSYQAIEQIFDLLLQQLHPFMPFITEELWHNLGNMQTRAEVSIMAQQLPKTHLWDVERVAEFDLLKDIVTGIRAIRQASGLPNRELLQLLYRGALTITERGKELVALLASVEWRGEVQAVPEHASSFMVGTLEFFLPLGDKVDHEAEKLKVAEEIAYYEGLRNIILKKLANPSFVNKAPENVVLTEKKKLADTETKLKALRERE